MCPMPPRGSPPESSAASCPARSPPPAPACNPRVHVRALNSPAPTPRFSGLHGFTNPSLQTMHMASRHMQRPTECSAFFRDPLLSSHWKFSLLSQAGARRSPELRASSPTPKQAPMEYFRTYPRMPLSCNAQPRPRGE